MKIENINNFNPSMKCTVCTPKYIQMPPKPIKMPEREYTLKYDSQKGIIKMTSNIPNAMDAICWYTLDKEGVASFQSCWQRESIKAKSGKLKKLYDSVVKETENGTKELSQERQKEIIDQIFEKAKVKK